MPEQPLADVLQSSHKNTSARVFFLVKSLFVKKRYLYVIIATIFPVISRKFIYAKLLTTLDSNK